MSLARRLAHLPDKSLVHHLAHLVFMSQVPLLEATACQKSLFPALRLLPHRRGGGLRPSQDLPLLFLLRNGKRLLRLLHHLLHLDPQLLLHHLFQLS